MFTGIVEELGEVVRITPTAGDSALVAVRGPLVTSDARHGDSIAVNGVCLTVVDAADGVFTADVMGETLRRSALGALRPGDPVNLERAAALGSRLGGHIVQGHVDGVGEVTAREPAAQWETVRFRLPAALARYVVEKGSVTVDGVSLTVAEVGPDWFAVGLIPTTLKLTTLGARRVGDPVNLEVDVLAKYVERLLGAAGTGQVA
jgi:riboflavin synthase